MAAFALIWNFDRQPAIRKSPFRSALHFPPSGFHCARRFCAGITICFSLMFVCPVASSLMTNNNVVIIYFYFSHSLDTNSTVVSNSPHFTQTPHGPGKSLRQLFFVLFFVFCLLPLLLPCLSTRPCCCWMDVCLQIKGLGMGACRASRPLSCRHFFLLYTLRDEILCLNVLRPLVACVCMWQTQIPLAQVDQSPANRARAKKSAHTSQ